MNIAWLDKKQYVLNGLLVNKSKADGGARQLKDTAKTTFCELLAQISPVYSNQRQNCFKVQWNFWVSVYFIL